MNERSFIVKSPLIHDAKRCSIAATVRCVGSVAGCAANCQIVTTAASAKSAYSIASKIFLLFSSDCTSKRYVTLFFILFPFLPTTHRAVLLSKLTRRYH